MRLLLLNWKDLWHSGRGGAERYVEEVARRWHDRGHDVTVLVPRVAGQPTDTVVDGLRVLRRGGRHTVFPAARAHLRRHGDDYDHVVEFVSTRPFFAHSVVGERATALYFQMADDVWPQEYRFPLSAVGRHLVEPHWVRGMRGAWVVALSASTAADLERRGVGVATIAPPGLIAPATVPDRSRVRLAPRLVYVGRLTRTKRPGDAIQAFDHVRQVLPSARLDVVGDGYLAPQLRRTAGPGVHFHGALDEAGKHAILSRADLVLLPGTREGWGIVALEAAGWGTPVVAYDVAGLRDAVVDGQTGLVVAPEPGALAAGALRLLYDNDRWERMSVAARQRAMAFTWERTAANLLAAVTADAAVAARAELVA